MKILMALTLLGALVTLPRGLYAADVVAAQWKTHGSTARSENSFPPGSAITIFVDKFHGRDQGFGAPLKINGTEEKIKKIGDVFKGSVDNEGYITIEGFGEATKAIGDVLHFSEKSVGITTRFAEVRVVVSI